jgi:hypothetical protein
MKQLCAYCKTQTVVKACNCGFAALLSCSKKSTCASCESAHRKVIGPFFKTLVSTKCATRSNSPRTLLFKILREAVVVHRAEIRESRWVFEMLAATSVFDESLGNFSGRCLDVASGLPLNAEFATLITRKVHEARIARAAERLDDAVRSSTPEQAKAVAEFFDEVIGAAR